MGIAAGEGGARGFRGVLLDWRGTLVVAPTHPWLVRTALTRLGRDCGPAAVDVGMTTLLLPALRSSDEQRLHHVLSLVLPPRRPAPPQ